MNNITIELCQEDRIRIDALNGHLSILNKALALISGQLEGVNAANEKKGLIHTVEVDEVIHVPGQVSIDEVIHVPGQVSFDEVIHVPGQVSFDEVIHVPGQVSIDEETAQGPQEAPQEVEDVQPLPITVIVQDEPTVTKSDIQQKVIELVGKGMKAAVRDIITTYADNVSGLPDSALVEVWDKLIALEKPNTQEG